MNPSPTIIDAAATKRVPVAPDQFTGWMRACIAVGRSLFGDDWNDAQTARVNYVQADRAAEIEAAVAKQFPAPRFTKAPAPPRGLKGPSTGPIDPQALERIKAGAEQIREQRAALAQKISDEMPSLAELAANNLRRKEMLANAQASLFDAILNGRIPAFWYRDGSTTLPSSMSSAQVMAAWNSHDGKENLSRRGYVWTDRAARYVYVDTTKLAEQFPLSKLPAQSVGSIPMDSLSPYLRLLIAVSLKQGISEENKSTPGSLATDLLAEAPHHGLVVGVGNDGSDISKTWAEQLAKAIRWPNARLGQAAGKTQKR